MNRAHWQQPARREALRRAHRWLLAGGLALLAPLAAFARSDTPPAPEPSFLIETITLEEAHLFSAEIIVAESLLEEGARYTERELREAVYRIVRLPLILDAEFSLRKGSVRDTYELVIRVEEARRWFFGLEIEPSIWDRPISVAGLTTSRETTSSTGIAGRRFSIGRRGVFFAALGGADGSLNLGYSHHDLGERGILLTTSWAFAGCNEPRIDASEEGDEGCRTETFDLGLDPQLSTWSNTGSTSRFRLSVGIPIEGNASIRVSSSYRRTLDGLRRAAFEPDRRRFELFEHREEIDLGVSWIFDAVDDPQFPTTGSRWEAGASLRSLRADILSFGDGDGAARPFDWSSFEYGLGFEATRYRPLGDRDSWWVQTKGFVGGTQLDDLPDADRLPIDTTAFVWRGGVGFGHARVLSEVRRPTKWRDIRWESEARLNTAGTSSDFGFADNPLLELRLASGVALRNRWGVFRLLVSWVDVEGL